MVRFSFLIFDFCNDRASSLYGTMVRKATMHTEAGDSLSLARSVRPWLMKRKMLRWSIIPEHIPWENRGVDPEKRNTPIEKA
jgi:hypothetical protein